MRAKMLICSNFGLALGIVALLPVSAFASSSLPDFDDVENVDFTLQKSRFAQLDGRPFPLVGFGTAGGVRMVHVEAAIRSGARLLDSAQATEWYSEKEVADGIAASGVPRSEIFITSKLHPRDLGFASTLAAIATSLEHFNTSYLDAFLLHYPRCFGSLCGDNSGERMGTWKESWRALEKLQRQGAARSIGVCNFNADELRELVSFAEIKPHLVQNWMDPLHHDKQVRAFCADHDIMYQSYSTLGTQWKMQMENWNPVLTHPALIQIARKIGQSVATTVISWATQSGAATIPSSRNPKHIEELQKAPLVRLSDGDMRTIDALDGSICDGNPFGCRVRNHRRVKDGKDDRGPANAARVSFTNSLSRSVSILWVDTSSSKEQLRSVGTIVPGSTISIESYVGHEFRAVDQNGIYISTFVVSKRASGNAFRIQRDEL